MSAHQRPPRHTPHDDDDDEEHTLLPARDTDTDDEAKVFKIEEKVYRGSGSATDVTVKVLSNTDTGESVEVLQSWGGKLERVALCRPSAGGECPGRERVPECVEAGVGDSDVTGLRRGLSRTTAQRGRSGRSLVRRHRSKAECLARLLSSLLLHRPVFPYSGTPKYWAVTST